MAWQGILGHDEVVERFRRSLAADRMGSTFLFVGPAGIGKRLFTFKLAQSLLCQRVSDKLLDPCGECPACQQVIFRSHPDLEVIQRPVGKNVIPVDLLIGEKKHRMREGLCARIAMKPMEGGRRIAIIDDADYLNQEGANCLLKTLEEPPPRSVLILIGTSPQRQLPTIRSRCQIVAFQPLSPAHLSKLIQQTGLADSHEQAELLSAIADGSLETAAELSDPAYAEFRAQLYSTLETTDWVASQLANRVSEFVDEVGKEASIKRVRLRLVMEMAIVFYRHVLHSFVGSELQADESLALAATRLAAAWPHDVEAIASCADRCLSARQDVDRNVNQATNIEAWLDDVAQIVRKGAGAVSPARVAV